MSRIGRPLHGAPVGLMLTANRTPAFPDTSRRCGENAMERLWLRHYPPGVAADIDPSRYSSLVAMFEQSFQAFAERPACICMGRTLTYAALDEASRAFATWLQSRGLKRGARVALMMPNVLQYP